MGDVTSIAGGLLTSFHVAPGDGRTALADFTGPSVDAVTWMLDVQQAGLHNNKGPIEALTSTFAYNFTGGSGNDAFGSAGLADTLTGGAGNDTLDPGGAPSGSHDTVTGGSGSDTFIYQAGYGAVTITDVKQSNTGHFRARQGNHILLQCFSVKPHGPQQALQHLATADFGNADGLTLLRISPGQIDAGNV